MPWVDLSAAFGFGTILTSTQMQNVRDNITFVREEVKPYIVEYTGNITLSDIASSYNAFGTAFSVDIPTSGIINGFMTGRLRADTASGAGLYIGIRIGTTNYWLGSFGKRSSGVITDPVYYNAIAVPAGSSLDYSEYRGNISQVSYSISAASIPTGTQTIQLIVARSSQAATLLGATTTSRFHLYIEGGK